MEHDHPRPGALPGSEQLYQALLDILPDCVKVLDLSGRVISINQAGLRLLEIPDGKQVEGTCWIDWWNGALRETLLDSVIRCAAGEKIELEMEAPTFTGNSLWWQIILAPLTGPDGRPTHILSTARDITLRKMAETGLDYSREERRLAMQTADIGWWRLDCQSRMVHQDELARQIYDIVEGETFSLDIAFSRIHPDDKQRCREVTERAMDPVHGGPYQIAYRVVRRDGTIRWVFSRGQVHFKGEGPDRRAVELFGTVLDHTAIREAQDALNASEARFRQLADAMPQIVFSARPDGHVDYFNRKWFEYTGFPNDGRTGDDSWAAVHEPDSLKRIARVWGDALRTGQPYEIEYRLKRHDGMWRWHLGRALPIKDQNGNIIRWFGTNTDIHDQRTLLDANQRLLESERSARSELEHASRVKDEFLATLSHELRTPLNAILGWTQILRQGGNEPDELEHALEIIERNTRSQAQIVEDLLDMSRIIAGKIHLDVSRVDAADILRSSVRSITPTASSKQIQLDLQIDPRPHLLNADPARLQQVFWNLLTNATKFTPSGGRVTVSLSREPGNCVISVSDTGEGIEPDFLPHVFERFRQANASTTRRHGGLGLGLSIARQLTELHGGTLRASSPGPDLGSTFTIRLPMLCASETPLSHHDFSAGPIAGGLPSLQGLRILVVDDDADARNLLRRLLEHYGSTVLTASSVAEALDLFKSSRPDIILSDIAMPDRDGYALIREVRAASEIPAIAITAYARPDDRVRTIRAGFSFHLAKPVEPAELVALIHGLTRLSHG